MHVHLALYLRARIIYFYCFQPTIDPVLSRLPWLRAPREDAQAQHELHETYAGDVAQEKVCVRLNM